MNDEFKSEGFRLLLKPTGSQKVTIVTINAKSDIHKQGKKYGNLQYKFECCEINTLSGIPGDSK